MSNFNQPNFPVSRLRRLRRSTAIRDMFRETSIGKADLIYPLFIVEGENLKKEISSMPGQFQLSIDNAIRECAELETLGINSVLLFGIPLEKDEVGSGAYADDGIIQRATRSTASAGRKSRSSRIESSATVGSNSADTASA